jgi:hypothetical protein
MIRCINRIFFAIAIAFTVSLFSCQKKVLGKQELIKYVEDNKELSDVKEVGDIKVGIKYYPYQLLALQELDTETKAKPDKSKVKALEKKYGGQYYFKLSFSRNNKEVIRELGSFSRYSEMLQVFSFSMGSYINATTERKDTIALKDYAFEQTYGMSAANSVMVAFDRSEFKGAQDIDVNVGEFGLGVGILKFTFRKEDLENVPQLKYDKL